MESIILDTSVLVGFLREKKDIIEKIKELKEENDLGTTDINVFELYKGAYKSEHQEKNLAAVKGLLNTLFIVSTNEDSMEMAAKILANLEKEGKPIGVRDLFIGSICLTNSFKLFTLNKKHFGNIEGLKIL